MAKSGIKNLEGFKKKLKKRLDDNTKKELKRLVGRSASLVAQTAIDSIAEGNKTGRVYSRGNRTKPHVASAPGEPPATDQGKLAGGITFKVDLEKDEIVGQVLSNSDGQSPYGVHLEFGTTNILPRPFMQPALEKNRPRIKRIFKDGDYLD